MILVSFSFCLKNVGVPAHGKKFIELDRKLEIPLAHYGHIVLRSENVGFLDETGTRITLFNHSNSRYNIKKKEVFGYIYVESFPSSSYHPTEEWEEKIDLKEKEEKEEKEVWYLQWLLYLPTVLFMWAILNLFD